MASCSFGDVSGELFVNLVGIFSPPKFDRLCTNRNIGCPTSANVWPISTKFARIWPTLVRVRPTFADFGKFMAMPDNFGPLLAMLREFGPHPTEAWPTSGEFGRSRPCFGQMLRPHSAKVGLGPISANVRPTSIIFRRFRPTLARIRPICGKIERIWTNSGRVCRKLLAPHNARRTRVAHSWLAVTANVMTLCACMARSECEREDSLRVQSCRCCRACAQPLEQTTCGALVGHRC